jgi:uncharacterized protein (TIGR02421 family)
MRPADIEEIESLLIAGRPIRRELPGGHLDIERPLPILLVNRTRANDVATPQLLLGHSSFLVVSEESISDVRPLLLAVIKKQADKFGAFLLLELWSRSVAIAGALDESLDFRVISEVTDGLPQPTEVLRAALTRIRIGRAKGRVEITTSVPIAPPGSDPLLTEAERTDLNCLLLGLELPAVYRDGEDGPVYPQALQQLRFELARAIQQTFFEFARVQTNFELKDHRELGRRELLPTGVEIDRKTAAIAAGIDFLFHITPVNTETAFREFVASKYKDPPSFHYRLLPFDPDLVKRQLYDLPIEDVTDPTVASLLREKRLELDRTITLLEDRDTPRFLFGSLQLYPAVDDDLLAEAEEIIDKMPPRDEASKPVTPEEFAVLARSEIDHYRAEVPEMDSQVIVRDDMPGILVSRGHLYLSASARVSESRVAPLIQHEVGTHIVTYQNGLAQPLLLLGVGLPGYEQSQEGLAMFAEYMSGGLDANRLRMIAARVIAVHMMTSGAGFVDIFDRMHQDIELHEAAAWSVTMRVTRGGGSSKDAIYLRGLKGVLAHLAAGHTLKPLLIGKIALEQVPFVEELLWRQVLKSPTLMPRWLRIKGAEERLARAQNGLQPIDLVER